MAFGALDHGQMRSTCSVPASVTSISHPDLLLPCTCCALPLPPCVQAFNVLKYEHNQHYDSHYDTFDPKEYGPQPSQRIATVLVYLSAPEEGGETVFKKEGWGGRCLAACSRYHHCFSRQHCTAPL